ncbi:EF-hand domain-containing protein [Arenibacterium sp. CAU 1754]
MKTIFLTTAIALGLSTASWAATELDTNGDGMLTLDEVQAVYPDVTPETFSSMDVNADGALDDDEVVAAQEAGMMPKTEG